MTGELIIELGGTAAVPGPVDIERLIVNYLNLVDTVIATSAEAATEVPPDIDTRPWIRVTLISDRQLSTALYFMWNMVQVDVYASKTGGQNEAHAVADVVRAALSAMPERSDISLGVVTSVQSTMRRIPDTALEPPRHRYIIDAYICALPGA